MSTAPATHESLAPGCSCGDCAEACSSRLFHPCCGACMNTDNHRTCPTCGGEGIVYQQIRLGQDATPFPCLECGGEGKLG